MTLLEKRMKEVGNGVLVRVPTKEYRIHIGSTTSLDKWIRIYGEYLYVGVNNGVEYGFMPSSYNLNLLKSRGYTKFVIYKSSMIPCKLLS